MKNTKSKNSSHAKFTWLLVLAGLFSLLLPVRVTGGTLFTSDTTINDATYDGQDIVIQACTVTINGSHGFNSVQVISNGTLTHSPATGSQTYSMQITIASNLVVDASSRIDVSGCGYLGGHTLGNTQTGSSSGYAGASYGGLGAWDSWSGGYPNAVYGDYLNPNELGSGGGSGGAGGGLVRIVASSAQIDGSILANGGAAYWSGAGSGGGILLNLGTLGGNGTIAANGGNNTGGYGGTAGGGGRVAVYYQTNNNFNLTAQVTAHGGTNPSPVAVGTVYLKQTGNLGQLHIDSHNTVATQWTPLGQATDTVFQVDELVINGSGVVAAPAHEMPIQATSVSVLNGGDLTHQAATASQTYSLQLTVASNLVVDASSRIDVSSRGYLGGHTLGNTTVGASWGYAGASYGGLALVDGYSGGIPNAVYGDYLNRNYSGLTGLWEGLRG